MTAAAAAHAHCLLLLLHSDCCCAFMLNVWWQYLLRTTKSDADREAQVKTAHMLEDTFLLYLGTWLAVNICTESVSVSVSVSVPVPVTVTVTVTVTASEAVIQLVSQYVSQLL